MSLEGEERLAAEVPWTPERSRGAPPVRAVVLLVVLAVGALAALALLEGIGPPTATVPLDPAEDGAGMVLAVPPGVVPAGVPLGTVAVAAAAVLGAAWLCVRGGQVVRALALVLAALGLGTGLLAARADGAWIALDRTPGTWAAGPGAGDSSHANDALGPYLVYPLLPGEPVTLAFTIRNNGPLPVSILGVGEEPWIGGVREVDRGFRITGMGRIGEPTSRTVVGVSADPVQAVVAWPVRLGPGEALVVMALGRAGPCAAGRMEDVASTSIVTSVPIVYRAMGWTLTDEVFLPAAVFVPTVLRDCG